MPQYYRFTSSNITQYCRAGLQGGYQCIRVLCLCFREVSEITKPLGDINEEVSEITKPLSDLNRVTTPEYWHYRRRRSLEDDFRW